MKSNSAHSANSQVTIRLPSALYQQIAQEAERMNTNIADATRQCLAEHFNRKRIEDRLDIISDNVIKLVDVIVTE